MIGIEKEEKPPFETVDEALSGLRDMSIESMLVLAKIKGQNGVRVICVNGSGDFIEEALAAAYMGFVHEQPQGNRAERRRMSRRR